MPVSAVQPEEKGAQHEKPCQRHGLGHDRSRQRREIALEPAPQPRPDHDGEGDDEEIGRHREDAAGLADTTQVGEGDQRDEPHTEPHAVAVQPRHGRRQGGHARRHAHGDGQHVVDQERGGRDQPGRRPEIGARDDVGAAARGIRVDRLLVRHRDHDEEARDGERHRHSQMQRRGAGQHEHEENLLRGVGDRRERVGREDGQGDSLRQPLVARLRQRHRLADDPALQETRVHRPPKRWLRLAAPPAPDPLTQELRASSQEGRGGFLGGRARSCYAGRCQPDGRHPLTSKENHMDILVPEIVCGRFSSSSLPFACQASKSPGGSRRPLPWASSKEVETGPAAGTAPGGPGAPGAPPPPSPPPERRGWRGGARSHTTSKRMGT